MNSKLRYGMIGGGPGAFIGAVHRISAAMDQQAELVCGSFSSNPEKTLSISQELGIIPDRAYSTFQDLIEKESLKPSGERLDFISIVTPNHLHFEPAKLAMENGFHVICDKPITFNLQEARELERISESTGMEFALTHTYTGYPMVKQAKEMVESGIFGEIRKVVAEYPQGWLSTPLEQTGQKQAAWRSDPNQSGKAGAVGDIGTHAANLIETVTNLKITELAADVSKTVKGRLLDDDANVLIRLNNGAKGVLHCSQICAGDENDVNIRVWGEKGGLEWHQHDPNTLLVKWLDAPTQIYRTGNPYLSEVAQQNTRTPAGHPEGYLEAFANIYQNFFQVIKQRKAGVNKHEVKGRDFPGVYDGIRGMKFIDAVIDSGENNAQWTHV